MGWPEFHARCRDAGGVVRLRATAEAAGLSPDLVRRRVSREGWWWPFPDVVAAPATVIDPRARAAAAVLAVTSRNVDQGRSTAAATGLTAAYLLGLQRAPTRPQVVIDATRVVQPATSRQSASPQRTHGFRIDVLRSRLRDRRVVRLRGVPTVTGAALVRDLAPICGPDRLRALVIDLVREKQVSLDDIGAHLDAHPRFRGRPAMRRVLAELGPAGRTDSPLELDARRRFAADGVLLDRGQVPVDLRGGGRIHLDLGILAIRFGIEANSMSFHSDRTELLEDAERANAIASLDDGWRIIRLTWDSLEPGRWGILIDEVRRAIAAQSRLHLGVDWPEPQHLRR